MIRQDATHVLARAPSNHMHAAYSHLSLMTQNHCGVKEGITTRRTCHELQRHHGLRNALQVTQEQDQQQRHAFLVESTLDNRPPDNGPSHTGLPGPLLNEKLGSPWVCRQGKQEFQRAVTLQTTSSSRICVISYQYQLLKHRPVWQGARKVCGHRAFENKNNCSTIETPTSTYLEGHR